MKSLSLSLSLSLSRSIAPTIHVVGVHTLGKEERNRSRCNHPCPRLSLSLFFVLCSLFSLVHPTSSSTYISPPFRAPIMSNTFSQTEVAAHKKPDDLWIIVDEDVYDLTKFQSEHPGESESNVSIAMVWAPG